MSKYFTLELFLEKFFILLIICELDRSALGEVKMILDFCFFKQLINFVIYSLVLLSSLVTG